MVVDDHSTDNTPAILEDYSKRFDFISYVTLQSKNSHQPGSKVIRAFNKGLETLDNDFDVICKFDADLIFPKNYLEKLVESFQQNPNYGMVGGFCYIQKNGKWNIENLTGRDHIRGALKAYRKSCFEAIGGLKESIGWDTVDELLAQYHGWKVVTDESLQVKHLKPTGSTYSKSSKYKQGEAFKKMRYGFCLTFIALTKLALKKKSFTVFWNGLLGFFKAPNDFLVSKKEGKFIRKLRWRNIIKRLF